MAVRLAKGTYILQLRTSRSSESISQVLQKANPDKFTDVKWIHLCLMTRVVTIVARVEEANQVAAQDGEIIVFDLGSVSGTDLKRQKEEVQKILENPSEGVQKRISGHTIIKMTKLD